MRAVQATFADFKTIKTRKVAQFVLEVPIEQADQALRALGGIPQPTSEQWVAVAPLDMERAKQEPEKKPMTPAQWAGMLCQDDGFKDFVAELGHDDPVSYVRTYCGVSSRSEIRVGTEAGRRWEQIRTDFDVWRGALPNPDRGAA